MSRMSRIALISALLVAAVSAAAPTVSAAAAASGSLRSATIIAPRWVYLDGDIPAGVRVATSKSTGRVRAELDLVDSTGVTRWHAVQTRSDLGSVTYEYSFFRRVADVGLSAGTYKLRARVTAAGVPAIERSTRLIIVDRGVRPVPVCVVVRVVGTPSPLSAPSQAEKAAAQLSAADAADIGRLAVLHPELHLSLAVPPFLLDQWRSIGAGEETTSVGPWADALDSLRGAAQSGVPFLRGMYADPDLVAIASAAEALERQLDSGDAALAAAFVGEGPVPSSTATGLAASFAPLPSAAAITAAGHGVRFVVVATDSVLPSTGVSALPGAYLITLPPRRGSSTATLTALAVDRAASRTLADPSSVDSLTVDLFERAVAGGAPARGVILEVAVGPGGTRASALDAALGSLNGLPWVSFVDAPTAATTMRPSKASLRERPADPAPAPAGYRETVDSARERVSGLVAAAGANDPDAALAVHRLMLAESRTWAGPDGSWADAERGLALARAADAAAQSILSKVTLDAPSVTLPGSEGRAPVSITNASDRNLTVVLEASSDQLRVRKARTAVRLKPGENVLSVPVALGAEPSGRLTVSVTAGGYRIATSTATVRASYQDRIVLLITAVLILVGLLFYIRRRMEAAAAGRSGASDDQDTGPNSR